MSPDVARAIRWLFFYFIRIIVWAVTNDTFGIIVLRDVSFLECDKYNMLLKWKSGNGSAYAEKKEIKAQVNSLGLFFNVGMALVHMHTLKQYRKAKPEQECGTMDWGIIAITFAFARILEG